MGREMIANTVTLTISPEGKTIPGIPWTEGMNVQLAMERAYEIPPGLSFAIQYFGSSLGYLVLMVDGTFDTSTEFWFLYVNGILSPTGIDFTILQSGDVVELRYQTYSESEHRDTTYHAKHKFHAELSKQQK